LLYENTKGRVTTKGGIKMNHKLFFWSVIMLVIALSLSVIIVNLSTILKSKSKQTSMIMPDPNYGVGRNISTYDVYIATINLSANVSFVTNGSFTIENLTSEEVIVENYYKYSYKYDGDKLIIEIDNPCVKMAIGTGLSMWPYWEDEELFLQDICWNVSKLKVGDIVSYDKEWSSGDARIHHRIIEINHEDGWMKTQGDNNQVVDDFVGLDRFYAKDIGVLNLLMEKRIVKEVER